MTKKKKNVELRFILKMFILYIYKIINIDFHTLKKK